MLSIERLFRTDEEEGNSKPVDTAESVLMYARFTEDPNDGGVDNVPVAHRMLPPFPMESTLSSDDPLLSNVPEESVSVPFTVVFAARVTVCPDEMICKLSIVDGSSGPVVTLDVVLV